uniref:Integrase catalytic domain-containing protein n=1 Tax=Meloidogyne enterolobii TaxID=390850 RepID=A0A6V7VNY4_MELEN|nr:unnamed protein product [Meloidogyne enterolobii]
MQVLIVYGEKQRKHKNIPRHVIKNYLEGHRTYTLMRPKRIRFPRSKTIAAGFMTDLQVDLADMQALSRHNKGNRYILVGIDVLSKRLFTVPLKTKKGKEMVKAFQDLIDKMPMKPHRIFSDKGTEFKNKQLREFFAKEDIQKLEANHSTVKASIAERSIRNIKQRLYRYFAQKKTLKWIDVLEKIVDGINHSISRVHGLRPIDVNFRNAQNVWKKIYGNIFSTIKNVKSKFNKGDYVRLSREKGNFEKGYLPNWGDEIVQVADLDYPITYKIKDDKGDKFKGSFYKEELARVRRDDNTEYRIENILRKRKRDDGANELLVKFIGYPETQWIHESQLAIDLVFDPNSSKNKSVVSPPRLDRRKRDLESTPSIDNLQSPPKASPPISPPRLDRKRKRDLQTPPRIDDLPESQPKINTVPKTPPKISPPKVNKPSSIEKNKVINIKEKEPVKEKDKADEKKITENEPLNDRQKKSGGAGQTQDNINQSSASQIEINEKNRQRIESMHVIPPAITPLFALGLPNTENTNNKTVVKDNDNEITIEEDKEENTDNVDTNKFTLWRGGIRLSGNLTLLKNMINSITFDYNNDFGRFFLKINHSNIDYISLSTQLCYVLGFENPQIIKNKDVAKYGSDLRGGFSSFGVYVKGLTEKMIIGDSLSSLLRVVSISGATPGEYNEKIYDTPIYSRVLPKEINDIEIELRTLDNGRLVPFSYGTVLLSIQKGGGLENLSESTYTYFKGASPFQRGYGIQRGAGIADVFRGLWRFFLPIMKRVGTTVSQEALNTGQRVLDRVNQGESIKSAFTSEGRKGIDTILDKGGLPKQFGTGRGRNSIKGGRNSLINQHKTIINKIIKKPKVIKKRIRSDAFGLY